jgi:uncharacterized membrane protein
VKKYLLLIIMVVVLVLPLGAVAQNAPAPEEFYRGEVVRIKEERRDTLGAGGRTALVQVVVVRFLEGPRVHEEETIDYGVFQDDQALVVGQKIILSSPNGQTYIFDRYRLPTLGWMLVLFMALAIVFARWRGVTSLLGLGVSIGVLMLYIVPQIMAGTNPLLVSLFGAGGIAIVSLYLAHGFNRTTSVAVVSTLITIVIAIFLSEIFVRWVGLAGIGSEEAYHLQNSPLGFINMRGLLLGGIIIGALGVLDDITTAQAAAVAEIWRANPLLTKRELFTRGSRVGREHITSLINTLALAYAGVSLPALLLFTVYQRPWWVVLNTETITEEIVRTLVGSIALMVAVPITTALAAHWLPRQGGTN